MLQDLGADNSVLIMPQGVCSEVLQILQILGNHSELLLMIYGY
jgi:hypothetical protein